METIEELVEESLSFIKENEPSEGYFVGFSGGKDSIVTLELCRMAGVKYQAFFSFTTIDPPETVSFIRKSYPEVKILRPQKSFFSYIQDKAPPLRTQRWCCDLVKEKPSWAVPLDNRIFGIRAEESSKRRERGRINPRKISKGRTLIGYHPIFSWPEWAVWQFIEEKSLPYPSPYNEGFNRLGCVVCPYSILGSGKAATKRRESSMQRWPGIWKAFRHAVWRYWKSKRRIANGEGCFEDFWKSYLVHFEVK